MALSPRMPKIADAIVPVDMDPKSQQSLWGFPGFTAMPPRPAGHLMRTPTNESEERPGKAACAAETGRPLPLFSRPLKQTHGASPIHRRKAARCPARCRNATLGARGASLREVVHAERRWRMHGGNKTPPAEAAPPLMGGKARFLRLVRGRLAANHSCSSATSSRHTSSPSNRP